MFHNEMSFNIHNFQYPQLQLWVLQFHATNGRESGSSRMRGQAENTEIRETTTSLNSHSNQNFSISCLTPSGMLRCV